MMISFVHVCLRRFAIGLAAASLFLAPPNSCAAEMIRVGSDVSAAPFEFFAPGGRQMIGFDIDLLKLLSAKLGKPIVVENHRFDQLLTDVRIGKFDLAISSITDTLAREKSVDFVDYFLAGGGLMVPAENPHRLFSVAALCGYTVAVAGGSVYEADLQEQSKKCVSLNLAPVQIVPFATGEAAFAAFTSGRTSAYITDYPVGQYRARTNGGGRQFAIPGAQFKVFPYGIAVSKRNPALRAAVVGALLAVIASGDYDALLRKWGLPQGALRTAPVNAGILFGK
jgi:polar amino acid transport system substrate-binding protein